MSETQKSTKQDTAFRRCNTLLCGGIAEYERKSGSWVSPQALCKTCFNRNGYNKDHKHTWIAMKQDVK